ncbi:MAG: hypothetical protein HY335_00345, partial [Deinococcus sp.]|nr:hypothetical protein [Deinococcus sp.]
SKELPPEERSMLAGARRILASELAEAQGLREEAVLHQIDSAVTGWAAGGK